MAFFLVKRLVASQCISTSHLLSHLRRFSCPRDSKFSIQDKVQSITDTLHLSPLLLGVNDKDSNCFKFELIDDENWRVVSSLADVYRGDNGDKSLELYCGSADKEDHGADNSMCSGDNMAPDSDEIEDMRVRGNLFYKLEKYSIEYEECKYDFHRRKPRRNEKNSIETSDGKITRNSSQNEYGIRERGDDRVTKIAAASVPCHKIDNPLTLRGGLTNQRTPTFNQLTSAYHEPFCLDIYISKASVRASIIHRATSKVVAVAHSISKDMKYDLKSTKNKDACTAVGHLLGKRALEDDIHNVVYTPRKGDKLEGKLKIVLESIMNAGVDVKLKLKQKNLR